MSDQMDRDVLVRKEAAAIIRRLDKLTRENREVVQQKVTEWFTRVDAP